MGENTAQKCKSVPASELPTIPRYLYLSPGSCCCSHQPLRPDIMLPYPGKWGTSCCSLLQGKSRCTMPRSCPCHHSPWGLILHTWLSGAGKAVSAEHLPGEHPAFPAEQLLPGNALCGCGHLCGGLRWMSSSSSSLHRRGEYRKHFCEGREIQSSRPSKRSSEVYIWNADAENIKCKTASDQIVAIIASIWDKTHCHFISLGAPHFLFEPYYWWSMKSKIIIIKMIIKSWGL